MKCPPLWQVSVAIPPEAEDAVGECLGCVFHASTSVYTDLERGGASASVYLDRPPDRKQRERLREALDAIRWRGFRMGAGAVSVQRLHARDWAESWKRHFPPIEIGSALLIKPGWSRRRPRGGQKVIVVNPGLSFGTGRHATTKFCLRQLAAVRKPGESQSFLDIGTGSGILAIAAAKLGYAPVAAFDVDAEAVRSALANVHRNRVRDRIRLTRADLTKLPVRGRKHDVICANLLANLLLDERRRLVKWLQPGGILILAGILRTEFPEVQRAYERVGFRLFAVRTEGEWRSGAFRS